MNSTKIGQELSAAEMCEINGGDDPCGCNQAGRDAAKSLKQAVSDFVDWVIFWD